MKKTFLLLALSLVISTPVISAPRKSTELQAPIACVYTPFQELIRNSRGPEQIKELFDKKIPLEDSKIKCGGSLLQLAIRRGDANIVNMILFQNTERGTETVSLKDFPIQGAPDEIPVVLFAAHYAPSPLVFNAFLQNKVDLTVTDKNGNNILWYMDKNPVLRKTETEDKVHNLILTGYLAQEQEKANETTLPVK